ncbi:MAG: hypothetical protein HC880_08270 [Bacteroidia bacterium]|nr:hypothetical protein [Bacteroidia bacterium]
MNKLIKKSGLMAGIGLLFCSFAWAQTEQTEKKDEEVRVCIQKKELVQEVLESDFSFYTWAKALQKNLEAVLDDESADVLFEIAEQKDVVENLAFLSSGCDALAFAEKELDKLKKIYDKGVQTKSSESSTPGAAYKSQQKVTLGIADARRMKIHVNSLVNMMEGDNSIFKIFR